MADIGTTQEVGTAGSVAGLVVGLIGGAKAGTVLLPIPVVGTFTGAVVGAAIGSGAGRFLAQGLVKVGDVVVKSATAAFRSTPAAS